MANKPSLTLKRHIKAAKEEVFAAWTDPQKLGAWIGPHDVRATAEVDARVGGRYRVMMHMADGEKNTVSGVFRELVPGRKIVFTWAWHSTPERESLVTVTLKPDGDGTLMTFSHEQFFDEKSRDGHLNGWTASFEKLDNLFLRSRKELQR